MTYLIKNFTSSCIRALMMLCALIFIASCDEQAAQTSKVEQVRSDVDDPFIPLAESSVSFLKENKFGDEFVLLAFGPNETLFFRSRDVVITTKEYEKKTEADPLETPQTSVAAATGFSIPFISEAFAFNLTSVDVRPLSPTCLEICRKNGVASCYYANFGATPCPPQ